MLLYSQIIARLPLFFPECSSISGKVCVTPPVAVSRFSQGKGRQYRRTWIWAKQPAYAMQRDSEGENCDRRSACATRKRTVREPLFMPYPGMRPLSSPAVVKALLLPLHCICELFRLYPRQPVLPALSLVETACRNRRRDTNFSGYGGPFRKIHRTFVHRTNNNRITVKRTWLKLKSKIQK